MPLPERPHGQQRARRRARAVIAREGGHRHLGGAEREAGGRRRGDDGAHAGRGQRAEQMALVVARVGPPGARGRRHDEDDRAEDHEPAGDQERRGRRGDDDDRRREQRTGDEDHLDGDPVQGVGGGQQAAVVLEQARQQRPDHGPHRRDGDPRRQTARHQRAGGRARQSEGDERPQRCRVQTGQRQHDPRMPVVVDQPPEDGGRAADAQAEGRRHQPGARERAGLGAHEEDHRQAVDPDRHAREDRGADQARDVRHPQDAGEALYARHGALIRCWRRRGRGGRARRRAPRARR